MKTKTVEYYRLWPGNQGDSGTWDTAFLLVPIDTPDDKLEAVVRQIVDNFVWGGSPPLFVAVYNTDSDSDEEEETEPCAGCQTGVGIRINVDPGCFTAPSGWSVVERCDLCNIYSNDTEAAELVGEDVLNVLCTHSDGEGSHVIVRLHPSLVDCVQEKGDYQGLATWLERRARAGVNSDDKEKEKGL